ncbi:hypothetical protein [Shewanella decolorationis]|uniref:hypothetical protein n=1 Tax=Shewanella decolorationis TaxID=256839 RepID=UPI001FB5D6DD|nr:hypothetical protein [Shewanella decolorationis]
MFKPARMITSNFRLSALCVDGGSSPWHGWLFVKIDGEWCPFRKASHESVKPWELLANWSTIQRIDEQNQLTDNSCADFCGSNSADIPYTPEEDAEFARIERNQQISEFSRIERNQEIALLANVIRKSPTTSAEAIAARVLDAGYRFDSSAVRLK